MGKCYCKNGDFESNDSSPRYWNYSGDVRILDSLGSYVHDNNLLFMSTGIGSKSDYNSSQVSQVFHIPENATTLTFSYNFISEEPMEWVGDEYDDEFFNKYLCWNVNKYCFERIHKYFNMASNKYH